MFEFMAGAAIVKEVATTLVKALEDPDTYKRLEGLRLFVSRVTGREIEKAAFIDLFETATQGDAYTGKWEPINPDRPQDGKRLRVEKGWIFDIGRGNALLVRDP